MPLVAGRAAQPRKRRVDGVLLLDKPAGPSSNQALQRVKRLFRAEKAGHAGTLDPLATGLLPILFGEATKFAAHLSDAAKAYEATLLLGVTTSTGDLGGEVIWRRAASATFDEIRRAVDRFRGEIFQTPPMHSAIKQGGRPLYELARRGEVVPRSPRAVFVDDIDVDRIEGDEIDIRVRCSKGTYIRVLGEDIGSVLGCGATLKRLRRVAVGGFDVRQAVPMEVLEAADEDERLRLLLPCDAGLVRLPILVLSPDQSSRMKQGQSLTAIDGDVAQGLVRLYGTRADDFLGLGEVLGGTVRPVRLVRGRAHENDT